MYWPIGAPRVYATAEHGTTTRPPNSDLEVEDEVTPTASRRNEERYEERNAVESGDQHQKEVQKTSQEKTVKNEKAGLQNNHLGHTASDEEFKKPQVNSILNIQVARHGHLFATITFNSLTIWQTLPTAVLATVIRSPQSLVTYGPNVALLIRPDSAIFVLHTSLGYLITYSLATDAAARVYRLSFPASHSRRQHDKRRGGYDDAGYPFGPPGGEGPFHEVSLRFRMAIKVDAGINAALALEDELVVATKKPPAVQCIQWSPDSSGNQTSTELMSRLPWFTRNGQIVDMVYDRPMNIFVWMTSNGQAYAVQRNWSKKDQDDTKMMFRGHRFHQPEQPNDYATAAAVNARFSLIAVGTATGSVYVYTLRDYAGNIPLSHQVQPSMSSSGGVRVLAYSPDGYCLFAGLEKGWMTASVFGKPGGNSASVNQTHMEENREDWLGGVRGASWVGAGSELLLLGEDDSRLWALEFARSAAAGCLSGANISRSLLLTKTGFLVYRGYDLPDLTSISAEATLWQTVQVPASYLEEQGPIRSAVVSSDGRYVAVAGRHGLAHYSISSGRWRTFDDKRMENEFTVRGGMCWHQHILIAAVETDYSYQVRLYSRELKLDNAYILHSETLVSPVVHLSSSGDDSLLVYTYENTLHHYILAATSETVELVRVGQIAFHGIIRAPARVRAMSWILPEEQLDDGDPSQDVTIASVLFLVDGKLALLSPSSNDLGEKKYDMRILAQNVEFYVQLRDQSGIHVSTDDDASNSNNSKQQAGTHTLRDSLWVFDGNNACAWTDVQDIIRSNLLEGLHTLPTAIQIPVDFYPTSILLNKGILLGVESELIQRRDISFAFFRLATRTQLFLPHIFQQYLSHHDSPAALHLAHHYQHLLYFPHVLEVLLHNVLDEEAEHSPPASVENALLPRILSFISSFPSYLDILVQCTRKTEVRSWRTLFAYLPPPQELFEESLSKDQLKTAGGYLLVLHTLEELGPSSEKLIRLLSLAKKKGDWDLCKELARFLMSLDPTGGTLREAVECIGLMTPLPGERMGRTGRGRRTRGFSLDGAGEGDDVVEVDHD